MTASNPFLNFFIPAFLHIHWNIIIFCTDDETRVKINTTKGDYINASFIEVGYVHLPISLYKVLPMFRYLTLTVIFPKQFDRTLRTKKFILPIKNPELTK